MDTRDSKTHTQYHTHSLHKKLLKEYIRRRPKFQHQTVVIDSKLTSTSTKRKRVQKESKQKWQRITWTENWWKYKKIINIKYNDNNAFIQIKARTRPDDMEKSIIIIRSTLVLFANLFSQFLVVRISETRWYCSTTAPSPSSNVRIQHLENGTMSEDESIWDLLPDLFCTSDHHTVCYSMKIEKIPPLMLHSESTA